MYTSAKMKPWECKGGIKKIPTDKSCDYLLAMIEDGFIPHPTTPNSVEIDFIDGELPNFWKNTTVKMIKNFVRKHKLGLANYGLGETGVVVTFRKPEDVVIFKLFWEQENAR